MLNIMARFLASVDSWIGRTLFVPLIVRWCQKFKVSQYRVYRVCWFVAWLLALYTADTLVAKMVCGLLSAAWCIIAALSPDNHPVIDQQWVRLVVIVGFVPFDAIRTYQFVSNWWGLLFDVIVLIAEYAATIRTIPPLPDAYGVSAWKFKHG